jgi:hypothetical protein
MPQSMAYESLEASSRPSQGLHSASTENAVYGHPGRKATPEWKGGQRCVPIVSLPTRETRISPRLSVFGHAYG